MDYSEEQWEKIVQELSPKMDVPKTNPLPSYPDVKIDLNGHFQRLHAELNENIAAELARQSDILEQKVSSELRRQADAQSHIEEHLKEEAITRAKDDRKYFWLGALISFVAAILVEHGPALIQFLQALFQP